MKRIFKTLKKKWPEYLLEIIVLIVGIYGAFALESWGTDKELKAKEKVYLKNLKQELTQNLIDLESKIVAHETTIQNLDRLTTLIRPNPEQIPLHSFDTLMLYYFIVPQHTPRTTHLHSDFRDQLSNTNLQESLGMWSYYYSEYQKSAKVVYDQHEENLMAISPFYQFKNLRGPNNTYLARPSQFAIDQRAILGNSEFENHVIRKSLNVSLMLRKAKNLKKQQQQIIELLSNETTL